MKITMFTTVLSIIGCSIIGYGTDYNGIRFFAGFVCGICFLTMFLSVISYREDKRIKKMLKIEGYREFR